MEAGIPGNSLSTASRYPIQNVFKYLYEKDPDRPLINIGDYVFDELFDESNRGVDSLGTPCLVEGPASWLITSNEETIGTDVPPAHHELRDKILKQAEADLDYDGSLLDGLDRPAQLKLHTAAKLVIRKTLYDWHHTRLEHNFGLNNEPGESEFMGQYYETRPGVFVPREETRPLSRIIQSAINTYTLIREKDENIRYLDIGCGTGNLALHAVLSNPRVQAHAVDINPEAVDLTYENFNNAKWEMLRIFKSTARLRGSNGIVISDFIGSEKNSAENIVSNYLMRSGSELPRFIAYESDAYESVEDERFDIITFDAPRRWFDISAEAERAYTDPWYESLRKIVGGASDHLSSDGVLMLTFAEAGDTDFLNDFIIANGLNHRLIHLSPHEFSGRKSNQYIYSISKYGPYDGHNDARRPIQPFIVSGTKYNLLDDQVITTNL